MQLLSTKHKEERGQLKDLRVTAFVSVVIPHSSPEAIPEGVLSRPEINRAFI